MPTPANTPASPHSCYTPSSVAPAGSTSPATTNGSPHSGSPPRPSHLRPVRWQPTPVHRIGVAAVQPRLRQPLVPPQKCRLARSPTSKSAQRPQPPPPSRSSSLPAGSPTAPPDKSTFHRKTPPRHHHPAGRRPTASSVRRRFRARNPLRACCPFLTHPCTAVALYHTTRPMALRLWRPQQTFPGP